MAQDLGQHERQPLKRTSAVNCLIGAGRGDRMRPRIVSEKLLNGVRAVFYQRYTWRISPSCLEYEISSAGEDPAQGMAPWPEGRDQEKKHVV